MTGKNVGDLLNAQGYHLGMVPGGLHSDEHCQRASRLRWHHVGLAAMTPRRNQAIGDYIPHH